MNFELDERGYDYWLYGLQAMFLFWTLALFELPFSLYLVTKIFVKIK